MATVITHPAEPGCHRTTVSEHCPFCCRGSSPSGHHHRLLKVEREQERQTKRGRESKREQGGVEDEEEDRTDRAGEMEPTKIKKRRGVKDGRNKVSARKTNEKKRWNLPI